MFLSGFITLTLNIIICYEWTMAETLIIEEFSRLVRESSLLQWHWSFSYNTRFRRMYITNSVKYNNNVLIAYVSEYSRVIRDSSLLCVGFTCIIQTAFALTSVYNVLLRRLTRESMSTIYTSRVRSFHFLHVGVMYRDSIILGYKFSKTPPVCSWHHCRRVADGNWNSRILVCTSTQSKKNPDSLREEDLGGS
jgi:hypothetical protein